jgi:hypothetical protein
MEPVNTRELEVAREREPADFSGEGPEETPGDPVRELRAKFFVSVIFIIVVCLKKRVLLRRRYGRYNRRRRFCFRIPSLALLLSLLLLLLLLSLFSSSFPSPSESIDDDMFLLLRCCKE